MTKYLVLLACALAVASAQTKVSGSLACEKSDPSHSIPVPDRTGYVYAIHQNKCAWTKAISVEGLDAKAFVNTAFSEVAGEKGNDTASGVTTYSNGDKSFTRGWGPFDSKAMTASGKWTFAGGTGKLRGITGGGTYSCKMKSAEPGSAYTCEVEGDYHLPAAQKK